MAAARAALGRRLAELRKAAGYTQHRLAPLTHYARSTIASVELGRQNVGRDFWIRCDQVLGTGGALVADYDRLRARLQQPALAAMYNSPSGPPAGIPAITARVEDLSLLRAQPPPTVLVPDQPAVRLWAPAGRFFPVWASTCRSAAPSLPTVFWSMYLTGTTTIRS